LTLRLVFASWARAASPVPPSRRLDIVPRRCARSRTPTGPRACPVSSQSRTGLASTTSRCRPVIGFASVTFRGITSGLGGFANSAGAGFGLLPMKADAVWHTLSISGSSTIGSSCSH
jgi:hypothetical protein